MVKKTSRRAIAPVISSIILCTMVLVLGSSVWSVTRSATVIMQNNYREEVMQSVDTIKERFYIENIALDGYTKFWVFNYGKSDVTIKQIYVTGGGNSARYDVENLMQSDKVARIQVSPAFVTKGLSISIKIVSARGNTAYDSIRVP